MIRVGDGVLEVRGSKVDIMSDISVILHFLTERGTLTTEDIDMIVKYAKMSGDELKDEVKEAYKKSAKESKKELLKSLSELLGDIISESESE